MKGQKPRKPQMIRSLARGQSYPFLFPDEAEKRILRAVARWYVSVRNWRANHAG